MSLGNGNAKASNKGSNFSHELKTLKVLNAISASTGTGATEATLQALLAAVEASKDYEVRIVNDSNPGGEVTFLEVRYWDVQDGTLGSPVYYLPGSDTPYNIGDPGGPVAPLSYVPTSTLLAQIVSELQAIKLDTAAIDTNTDNLEALLTTIDAVIDQIQTNTLNTVNELTAANVSLNNIDNELIDQGNSLDVIDTKLTDGTQIIKITSNTAKDGTGTDLYPLLDADGHLQVDIVSGGAGGGASNIIDSNNSTITPLGAGAVFTGTGTDVTAYNSVTIQVFADQDSAADGMSFQFSPDNVNWDEQNDYNLEVSVSGTRRFQFPVTAQYFRVVYTNGGVAQTAFRVQTILHTSDVLTSIHRLDTGLTNDRSVTVTKSVIAGETSAGGGAFVNVKVAPSGSLETNANQDTHDNLNANANIQVGDVDVSGANPVPTTMASTTVTPNLVRSTGAGTIPLGARSFSIANVGTADADILGGINNLKAGEVVNFDAGLNNTYGLVVYDATGTELLITYNS